MPLPFISREVAFYKTDNAKDPENKTKDETEGKVDSDVEAGSKDTESQESQDSKPKNTGGKAEPESGSTDTKKTAKKAEKTRYQS